MPGSYRSVCRAWSTAARPLDEAGDVTADNDEGDAEVSPNRRQGQDDDEPAQGGDDERRRRDDDE